MDIHGALGGVSLRLTVAPGRVARPALELSGMDDPDVNRSAVPHTEHEAGGRDERTGDGNEHSTSR